jgi:pimeloyl-ACP methyl ester carboxylesterase
MIDRMTKQSIRATLIVAAIAAPSARIAWAQQPTALANRFVGTWVGSLQLPTAHLRMALEVKRDSAGALAGVMTSLDQGNAQIPGKLSEHGDTLVFDMPALKASYTGVMSATNDSLRGSFAQGMSIPLNLGRAAALPVLNRPQTPKPPFPYRADDVSFESDAGVRLSGTITMPAGAGPFPAVVMVTGSGPQNRDEELLSHKPFLVIADYLARHGIAALRYDDRGVGKSTGSFAKSTSADFANDAEAAVKYLRSVPGIASDHVGIMGHSEGGLIAPMVAARSKDVAFVVLLAGPGIPGDSILLLQEALIAAASGTPQAMIDQNTGANRRLFAALKASKDSADAVARLSTISQRMVATLPEGQQAEATRALAAAQTQLVAPWMRYFIAYDPRPALRNIHVPLLALNGTLDLQVPYKANLPAIEAALKEAGNRDYRIVEMPGLNHLFQTAGTGAPTEYSSISETFSPAALDIIATWINAHAGRTR